MKSIGVFGPGSGALTITAALHKGYPGCPIVHFSDQKNAPYGSKDPALVFSYVKEGVGILQREGCEKIVLGCNTSSLHVEALRRVHPRLEIVSLIELSTESIARSIAANGHLLLLATRATLASGMYQHGIRSLQENCTIETATIEKLPQAIDSGASRDDCAALIREALERCHSQFTTPNLITLCCTHYPIVQDVIAQVASEVFGREIQISSQYDVAYDWAQAYRQGEDASEVSNSDRHVEILTNGGTGILSIHAGRLLQSSATIRELQSLSA